MNIKKLGKFIAFTATACIAGFVGMFSACTIETDHPGAEITVEFLDKTYKLEYTLYRNMYPQTVRHFIELADNGFYNDMIVHDYTTNDWYTGGYAYNESYKSSYTAGSMDEYYEMYSKQTAYNDLFNAGKLTASVYKSLDFDSKGNEKGKDALSTLYGEFKNNNHTIKYNALRNEFGALHMYYVTSSSSQKTVVAISGSGEVLERTYANNCATSMFAIQANSSSSLSADSYCVFATLKDKSDNETLLDLTDAISKYIEDNLNGITTDFYKTSVTATMNEYDQVVDAGSITKTCNVPIQPLIIKSVKIVKY